MFASPGGAYPSSSHGTGLRSADSLAFEEAWEAARDGLAVPTRSAIELKRIARFAPRFAVIEPGRDRPALPFRLVGSGFFDFFGQDLTGLDYLTLVDPVIARLAYDSVIACLDRPCGLWQSTPAATAGGGRMSWEYTILPIAKSGTVPDQIMVYVDFDAPDTGLPAVRRVEHSTVWHWLDIGWGVPKPDFGGFAA